MIESVRTSLGRLHKLLGAVLDESDEASLDAILARTVPADAATHRAAFCAAMDDDFNTAAALAELHALSGLSKRLDGGDRQAVILLLRRAEAWQMGLERVANWLRDTLRSPVLPHALIRSAIRERMTHAA